MHPVCDKLRLGVTSWVNTVMSGKSNQPYPVAWSPKGRTRTGHLLLTKLVHRSAA